MTLRAFDGIQFLLIDANNVLHRLAGAADPTAQRTLLPRLRATIPETVATVFMLDGRAETGAYGRERVRPGFDIRHSGSMSGDDALLRLISNAPPEQRHAMTLVSDDIALSNRARTLGARTKRLVWLEQLIGEPPAKKVSIGTGSRAGQEAAHQAQQDDRVPWQPGRGATRKIGNPKRGPSGQRRARGPRWP